MKYLLEKKTLLNEITGCIKGAVNSSHHQCVETLGTDLLIAARAEDPIVEAIQWQNAHEKPFYLGVQWHPERMVDQDNPFSYNTRKAFLDYIIEHEEKTNLTVEEDTPPKVSENE